jgi:23S rRNA (uracil1939-C5)-methyltransferase
MNYEHQLAVKQRQVEQILRRIGGFAELPIRPIVPSRKPYEYRNRITVHCEDGVVGYYRRDVHRLVDVERCPIARPEVNAALAELRANKPRDGHYTLRAYSGPRVFSQTNDEVAEALGSLIENFLPPDHELLIDAYCGAGFFTKRFREKFARVIGIEWDRFAIEAAQKEIAPNESYIAGDVEKELQTQLQSANLAKTTIIVDPPATGLSAEIRRAVLERAVATLIYVSCNPATLARDLKELSTSFSIQSITPLDMFPQTAEIEVVAHLRALATAPGSQ